MREPYEKFIERDEEYDKDWEKKKSQIKKDIEDLYNDNPVVAIDEAVNKFLLIEVVSDTFYRFRNDDNSARIINPIVEVLEKHGIEHGNYMLSTDTFDDAGVHRTPQIPNIPDKYQVILHSRMKDQYEPLYFGDRRPATSKVLSGKETHIVMCKKNRQNI